MKQKTTRTKVLPVALAAALGIGMYPVNVLAVTGDAVAKDGIYTKSVHVKDAEEEGWAEYNVDVALTVQDGKIAALTVKPDASYDEVESDKYFDWAQKGRTKKGVDYPGYESLIGQTATEKTIQGWDAVSGATCTSDAVKTALLEAIHLADAAQSGSTEGTGNTTGGTTEGTGNNTGGNTEGTGNNTGGTTEGTGNNTGESTEGTGNTTGGSTEGTGNTTGGNTEGTGSNTEGNISGTTDGYKYVFAGLSWAEYWAAEGVQAGSSAASSSEADSKGEYDKGAFDTVTRATTTHGLHRGSFQCMAKIYMKDGTTYDVAYYTGATTCILTDGTELTYDKNDIDHYIVTGLKYVPVKVAEKDYAAFCETYPVVENGGSLSGGFSEMNLTSYSGRIAEVTAETNGLKTATRQADGSFAFSTRAKGTQSGIQGAALKTAPDAATAGLTVKEANGSYGEFLRVDLLGDYGDLGSNMQSVKWTYYGNDSTYTTPLASYGTKFAADNWMHKKNGIQLGLTESARCTLPEGTDGTGYWAITLTALGYQDAVYQFQASAENIVTPDPVTDLTVLKHAIAEAKALQESVYTPGSWANLTAELKEAEDELAAQHSQSAVAEAAEHLNSAIAALKPQYLLMNIPYAAFYKADVKNAVEVDTFTSATKNKTRTGTLSGGSYHVDKEGTDITGVTFPVKITDELDLSAYTQVTDDSAVDITVTNKGKTSTTTYTGKDALYESATYSWYALSEVPAYYKEVSVGADGTLLFGATVGEHKSLDKMSSEFTTHSSYGDYQMDLTGLRDMLQPADTETPVQVYGVIVRTTDGSDYGMRHVENIWRVEELAWSTGFTDLVHNCPTSSDHYASMMGKTINQVTYYTSVGIYDIPVEETYVPVKFTKDAPSVENAPVTAGKTAASLPILPEDFQPVYKVGEETVQVADGVLTYQAPTKGKYTLTVSDASGKYADLKADFILYTESMPAVYNEDGQAPALVAAEDASAEAFADYIKNITAVTVNGKTYNASGKRAVVLIKEDGSVDTGADAFAEGTEFEITVSSTGYLDKSFTYTKAAPVVEVDVTALENAVTNAQQLRENDYTAESWSSLKTALDKASSVLETKESQTEVDRAADALNVAMQALVKKPTEETGQKEEQNGGQTGGQNGQSQEQSGGQTGGQNGQSQEQSGSQPGGQNGQSQEQSGSQNSTQQNGSNSSTQDSAKNSSQQSKSTTTTAAKSSSDQSANKAVKTGDASGFAGWIGLLAASLTAAGGTLFKKRRRRKYFG